MINQEQVSQITQKRLNYLDKSAKAIEIKQAQQEIVNFYSSLRDFPRYEERMGNAEFERERIYFLTKLIEIKNAPLASDKGKVRQDLENNGLLLPDLIKLYNKNNKSEKETIEEIRTVFLNNKLRVSETQSRTLTSQEKLVFQDPIIDNLGSMH